MLESVQSILDEYAELELQLADPAVHGDQDLVRTLNKRYAALAPTVAAAREWTAAGDDLAAARELAADDESFAAELPSLEARLAAAEEHLRRMLMPRDPDDDRDVILEVKAGEGGDESALFAGDLLRMYLRYAEQRGWRTEPSRTRPSPTSAATRTSGSRCAPRAPPARRGRRGRASSTRAACTASSACP